MTEFHSRMQTNRLEDSPSAVERVKRDIRDIEAKLAKAKEAKEKEESTQFLLRFELAQLQTTIDRTKKQIEDMSKLEKTVIESNLNASIELKRIRNYFGYVGQMQIDRKSEWMTKLKGTLDSLDFTIEEFKEEPTRSVESFTQVTR